VATATCHQLGHLACCDAVAAEAGRFVSLARELDHAKRVPTCPDWTGFDLIQHLGTVHRWAGGQVAVLTPKRIPSAQMDLEEPEDPNDRPAWLEAGARNLVDVLRAADPDAAMWGWGSDPHARFWSRRQLHETAVHRADAEFTLERDPEIDAAVAIDGVDEFLDNLPFAAYFAPRVKELTGDGTLAFRCSDADVAWTIRLGADGFTWDHADADGDVALEGTASDLVLFTYGRRTPDDPGRFKVTGDRALLDFWRERSSI
jgi:uncharacterized protein (TIGR03083 family)